MGGFGSGRTEYATTPDERDCLKLDVNEFTDHFDTEDGVGNAGTYVWRRGDEKTGRIAYLAVSEDDGDGVILKHETGRGDDRTEHEYMVAITRTECHFGGTRPWWLCPECGGRVGTLYLPIARSSARTFACRDCRDVAYLSSRASGNTDRTLRMRYNRIRKKLGADPAHPNTIGAVVPDRPKGMHQDTYEELVDELRRAEGEWYEQVYIAGLQKYAPDDYEVS